MLLATSYGDPLAVATFFLALVSCASVVVSARAARDTRKLAQTAEDEVAALREQIAVEQQEVGAVLEQATIARDQVALSRESIETQIRPLLVDVPPQDENGVEQIIYENGPEDVIRQFRSLPHYLGDNKFVHLSVPFRNIGSGAAFIQDVRLRFHEGGGSWKGRASSGIVAAGELVRTKFSVPTMEASNPNAIQASAALLGRTGSGMRRVIVELFYVDSRGGQGLRSQAYVAADPRTGAWEVLRVDLLEPGAASAFASTGDVQ